jgi:isopentenyl diphosphate isomerase/L-lactate dehydrogenase-like FMN-dependent dehydrogenase
LWALRGAGNGNFGIVTSLTYHVIPLTQTIYITAGWPGLGDLPGVFDAWQRCAPYTDNRLTTQLEINPGDVRLIGVLAAGSEGEAAAFPTMIDAGLTWEDVAWLRSITTLPILVKGIVRADDAERAVEAEASGIIVSNHGGRQLDTAPATIDVLGSITQAVGNRIDVLFDGGIRRGTDVVKALALGARAVQIGRPVVWGLATDGQKGVTHVFNILQQELDVAMALCGCRSLDEITPDLISP